MYDESFSATGYLQHLSDQDLRLLGTGMGWDPEASDVPARLRGRPELIEHLLDEPTLWARVFPPPPTEPQSVEIVGLSSVSPFLVFAAAVARTRHELAGASYVSEWFGLNRRTPVFDVAGLRDFLSSAPRRLFLAELLASYTHVASGSILVATRRGHRRQRYSELDMERLAALLEVLSEAERPGIYRRLGDLALFLTGVFPDNTARRGIGAVQENRLLRTGHLAQGSITAEVPGMGDPGAVTLFATLGQRWYELAYATVPRPIPRAIEVVGEIGARFDQARKILNMVTDRYLFPLRNTLFGSAGT